MAEQNYGALTGLNLDKIENQGVDPITYNVYQTRSQNTGRSDQDIQNLYGTSQMPVFEWVKRYSLVKELIILKMLLRMT